MRMLDVTGSTLMKESWRVLVVSPGLSTTLGQVFRSEGYFK